MEKVAILLSGHLRNFSETIDNFKDNLIEKLPQYDVYVHTWDINHTGDNLMSRDYFFNNETPDIRHILEVNKINVGNIIIENQEYIKNTIKLNEYLDINTSGRTFHSRQDGEYVKEMVKQLFFQYYGHFKTLNLIDKTKNYTHIIKTRPDMLYTPFDINLLKHDLFFPNSHRMGGMSINNLFFGGVVEKMTNVLNYFSNTIYKDRKNNKIIINKYDKSDINFNKIFRFYVENYLGYKPHYCGYNPKIYRDKNNIINVK